MAKWGEAEIKALLDNDGIIRNRLKIESAINNAKRFFEVQKEFGSFDAYLWGFVGGKQIQSERKCLKEVPPDTDISQKISKDLKKRGFKFVGPTLIYAHMQAVGLVNDHTVDCFRYAELTIS